MRDQIQVGATIRYNQSGSTIWSYTRYIRAQYFLHAQPVGSECHQWGLALGKKPDYFDTFLYVSQETKHLPRLSDCQAQNEKPSTNGKWWTSI